MNSHLNDVNLAFLDTSDTIIEIVTYDSTTVHKMVAMADTFRAMGYPASKVHDLVNRADLPAESTRATSSEPSVASRNTGWSRTASSSASRTTKASRSCSPTRPPR